MSDENSVIDNAPSVAAVDSTPTPPQADAAETTPKTTATEPVEAQPETADDDHEPAQLQKGVQKRIDKLTQQRYERDARIRELEARLEQQAEREIANEPKPEQFDSLDDFVAAKVEFETGRKMREVEKQAKQASIQQARIEGFNERAVAVRQQNPDFDVVLQSAAGTVSNAVMDVILEADDGPGVAYYLAKNPTELAKINSLSERQQVLELGRISARLSMKQEPRVTKAPPPPPTVQAKASSSKNFNEMTDAEYLEYRKRQNAQRNRR